ncbi:MULTISPECIES: DUF6455 family protein [unclassified Marinovum]
MIAPQTIKRHAALMDRMATAHGLDMEEQVLRGKISSAEIADAVLSCTNCTNPDGCAHWLDTQTGVAAAAPDQCRNAGMFSDLLKA